MTVFESMWDQEVYHFNEVSHSNKFSIYLQLPLLVSHLVSGQVHSLVSAVVSGQIPTLVLVSPLVSGVDSCPC